MTTASISLPKKLIPVFSGSADIRGAYGGRGSAKTRSFAKMAAVEGYRFGTSGTSGIILCARQFMNSLADSSLEEIKRAIEDEPWLLEYYVIGDNYIKSRDGRIQFAFAGLDRNIASIKSKGRLLLCWIDEAEPVTDEAFQILIPTLREEGEGWNAELWITWNPARENAAVEKRYRNANDPLIKIAELNWRDNPKFPAKLERDRQRDEIERPEDYPHIWEGKYRTFVRGSYYAIELKHAEIDGRFTAVPHNPDHPVHTAWDLGFNDDTGIWFYQVIAGRLKILEYYGTNGKDMTHYVEQIMGRKVLNKNWEFTLEKPRYGELLQESAHRVSYKYGKFSLPHDARAKTLASGGKSIQEKAWAAFGQNNVRIVPSLSVQDGIMAVRSVLPLCEFDLDKTAFGLSSLKNYQREWDEDRQCFKDKPLHDWTSHGADAFRYLAIAWSEEYKTKENTPILYPQHRTIDQMIANQRSKRYED
jgi:phage terminase large subunit